MHEVRTDKIPVLKIIKKRLLL